jgi:hypothetical protein
MTESNVEGGTTAGRLALTWRWMRQGARSAFLLRPDWRGLRSTPGLLLLAVAANLAFSVGLQRFYIAGEATFYWRVIGSSFVSMALLAWGCWFVMPAPAHYRDPRRHPVDAQTLFTMFFVQAMVIGAVLACIFVPATHLGTVTRSPNGWLAWVGALLPMGWFTVAEIRLVAGSRAAGRLRRALAGALVVAVIALDVFVFPQQFWYPARPVPAPAAAGDEEDGPPLKLTQEIIELQPRLLAKALDGLKPQRQGVVDVYAITFAPYASQDVFMRESALVAGVMAQRFDAAGRTIQLVNNKATASSLPWATPLNLQRTIQRIAARMDRNEDVLFIHLTSHGGKDGNLAAEFDPMTIASVTPGLLRLWLDAAGIRNRVISVSACYSGSWIAPLADDGTLVMTAADADHTSYGCGSLSPITFFGRAMYDEELRHTWSFEQAHAAARKVIEQREREVGKDNGYSNPQIRTGEAIRKRLARLEAQLAVSAPH